MTRVARLGWGRRELPVAIPPRAGLLELPPPPPPAQSLAELLRAALAAPIGSRPLTTRIAPGARVALIVSDATRDEPRGAMLEAIAEELPAGVAFTLAIANGTHRPGGRVEALGLPAWARRARLIDHDAWDPTSFVDVGVTRRGTRVRFPRWLREMDLAVAVGRIRPHYFAGFGAGAKAIFPGLGYHEDIRANHLLKAHPSARLGRIEDNACRDDLEEATHLLDIPTFLLNVVLDEGGAAQAAVAGDPRLAFRAGAATCRALCEVVAPRVDVVVVSDRLPLTATLYQASKLLAPAAACLRPDGVVVLAAECGEGTGPLDTVNEAIYRLGLRPLFDGEPTIYLVSLLPEETVAQTYCRFAPSVEWVLERYPGDVLVLPSAGSLIPQVEGKPS
jgi:nickel-dependent lactate racemase